MAGRYLSGRKSRYPGGERCSLEERYVSPRLSKQKSRRQSDNATSDDCHIDGAVADEGLEVGVVAAIQPEGDTIGT